MKCNAFEVGQKEICMKIEKIDMPYNRPISVSQRLTLIILAPLLSACVWVYSYVLYFREYDALNNTSHYRA